METWEGVRGWDKPENLKFNFMLSGVKVMGKLLFFVAVLSLLLSCNSAQKKNKGSKYASIGSYSSLDLKYAKGFKLRQYDGFKHLMILSPSDTSKVDFEFVLSEKGVKIPRALKHIKHITTPVDKSVCLTLTQLSYVIKLDAIDAICGINASRYLFNEKVKAKVNSGDIKIVGRKGNFKTEIVMAEQPDIIFVSPFKEGGYDNLKDVGFTLVPVSSYSENTPLGRAEWLKFMAVFFGKEKEADSIFNAIEKRYNDLKLLTKGKERPQVFSGECKSGVWYGVGGQSYLAHYFRDAGADYVWKDNKETGAMRLDFESVYAKAANAKYWRILNSHKGNFTYNALLEKDERYADFSAYKDKSIVYCNMRQKAFYERSPVEPDVLLADYIKAFHPDLLTDYTPKYYSVLKD